MCNYSWLKGLFIQFNNYQPDKKKAFYLIPVQRAEQQTVIICMSLSLFTQSGCHRKDSRKKLWKVLIRATLPKCFQQDAELLRSSKGKHGDQNLGEQWKNKNISLVNKHHFAYTTQCDQALAARRFLFASVFRWIFSSYLPGWCNFMQHSHSIFHIFF